VDYLISTSDLTNIQIEKLFIQAKNFNSRYNNNILDGKLIATLFFENSTRTRSSFEIAAKRLGADVVCLDVSSSSTSKGESILDTVTNLDAMNIDAIIVRHSVCGFPKSLSSVVTCPIINAGDGMNAHPTQALLDLYTIQEHFKNDIKGKKIAIVGDVKTSRVAASNLELLPRFGIEPIIVAPKHFRLYDNRFREVNSLKEVINEVDIVMSLRTQLERHSEVYYNSLEDYAKDYCITSDIIGSRDILLLHPGPVNRNIDISDDMIIDKRSKILRQVSNGVLIRMSILKSILS
jgi:aspartate carbamoyltransferase catalytic subunit